MSTEHVVVEAVPATGILPKVKVPAQVLTGIGVALVIVGLLLGDDHIYTVGFGLVGGGPLAGLIGYATKLGLVKVPSDAVREIGPASDALLVEGLKAKVPKTPPPERPKHRRGK